MRAPFRNFRFTIPRGGWVFMALAGFIYIAAVNSGVNLLYLVFGMAVGALVLSFVVGLLTMRGIQISRDFGEHVVAGEPTDIVYRFVNRKRYWPAMALHFREVHPDLSVLPQGFILYMAAARRDRESLPVTITSRLVAPRRGLVRLSEIELTTTFPFGFVRCSRRIEVPQEMIVYPRIGMLNRYLALQYRESIETGTMTSNRRGGNDEFYGVREYRPGDNVRAIHWRSTARTGELMMREMAANAPPQLIVVLNIRTAREHPHDEAVERAIELAAALLCYGFFENFAVALAIAGLPDQMRPSPQMGREARARMLRQLAVLDPARIRSRSIDFPNRLASRAQWVIVTLRGSDPVRDLFPRGAGAGGYGAGGASGSVLLGAGATGSAEAMPVESAGSGIGNQRTVLALDAPDSKSWIHFLSAQDTLRLLRDRGAVRMADV